MNKHWVRLVAALISATLVSSALTPASAAIKNIGSTPSPEPSTNGRSVAAMCDGFVNGSGAGTIGDPYIFSGGKLIMNVSRTIALDAMTCEESADFELGNVTDLTEVLNPTLRTALVSEQGALLTVKPLMGGTVENPQVYNVPLKVYRGSDHDVVNHVIVRFNAYLDTETGLGARPVCKDFTVTTTQGADVEIDPFMTGLDRCTDSDSDAAHRTLLPITTTMTNSDPLTVSPRNGTVHYGDDSHTLIFSPDDDYLTPSDQVTDRAQFKMLVSDEYGNSNTITVIINVNKAVNRGGSACRNYVATSGPIFNDPTSSASNDKSLTTGRFAITNNIIKMIDCAHPGSIIAMSWFSMTDDNMANHLVQAARAGVYVRFIINSHSTKTQTYKSLQSMIKGYPTSKNVNAVGGTGSFITSCNLGCLTPTAPKGLQFPDESEAEYPALHAKFFMFSHTGASKWVSGVASSNPTYEQAKRGFNNAFVYVGQASSKVKAKKKLYNSLSTYFTDLVRSACTDKQKVNKYYASCKYPKGWKAVAPKNARVIASDDNHTKYLAFPRANTKVSSSSDDITQMLNNVQCVYKDANGKKQRTVIKVNMFVFTRNSPAMKLWRLANGYGKDGRLGGCDVQILYTDMDSRIKGLNTRTGQRTYLPAPNGKISNWGAADCLSTNPIQTYGKGGKKKKVRTLTSPGRAWSSTLNRVVTTAVCNQGSLQGSAPTINSSNYCWKNTKNPLNGGTLKLCVSTPLRVNANDTADARAKLEAAYDSGNAKWYTHQKYVLIDGMVSGVRQSIVMTGNTNISVPALRWNDEIMAVMTKPSVYKAYSKNFDATLAKVKKRKAPNRCGDVTSDKCSTPYIGRW